MSNVIGQPMDRVDGRAKTTGQAKYAAEFSVKNAAYGITVQSSIARGAIRSIDTSKASGSPGVIGVMTYLNAPRLVAPPAKPDPNSSAKYGEKNLLPLQSAEVFYNGQHIAVVVANSFEEAECAADLIEVLYQEQPAIVSIEDGLPHAYSPKESMGRPLQALRGNVDGAWAQAPVQLQHDYSTPTYHHNPMEPHATIAGWHDGELTVFDSTQSISGQREAIAKALGLAPEKVRVVSPFVGGGFGCKGFTWPHALLAPMAAKLYGRPVKLVLDRQQMFTCNGHRAPTTQQISLGADKSGKLLSIKHEVLTSTSFVDEFVETAALQSQILYECANVQIAHSVVKVNRGTPTATRAPGEAPGTYAIEVALDELAHQLGIDPIELRLRNYAERDPQNSKPWSSKNLKEYSARGAEAIGWSKRNAVPGTIREGNCLVGYGMATATYPGNRAPASASVKVFPSGKVIASSGTQDIGTGTYTIMTQIVAETLGVSPDQVEFRLGDSTLPKAPVSGGSQTAASVGPAVKEAALAARRRLIQLATSDQKSPLAGHSSEGITVDGGRIFSGNDSTKGEPIGSLIARQKMDFIEGRADTKGSTRPNARKDPEAGNDPNIDLHLKADEYSFHSFGAQFVRLLYDPMLGTLRLTHCAAVMDIGKVLNLKTAENQIMGGMIFGIGMALMEETIYDERHGRVVTRDLANYLVPVHADMPEFDVQFIGVPDPHIGTLGARGIGEIGITGITAAISNAIFNASGKRIRHLPITPDKLLLA